MDMFLAEEEKKLLQSLDESECIHTFGLIWSIKESILKCIGVGLNEYVDKVIVSSLHFDEIKSLQSNQIDNSIVPFIDVLDDNSLFKEIKTGLIEIENQYIVAVSMKESNTITLQSNKTLKKE